MHELATNKLLSTLEYIISQSFFFYWQIHSPQIKFQLKNKQNNPVTMNPTMSIRAANTLMDPHTHRHSMEAPLFSTNFHQNPQVQANQPQSPKTQLDHSTNSVHSTNQA